MNMFTIIAMNFAPEQLKKSVEKTHAEKIHSVKQLTFSFYLPFWHN